MLLDHKVRPAPRAAALPGYDLLVQAVGGLMSITGPDGDCPTKVGVAIVDVITCLHASVGILAALRLREATGQGQRAPPADPRLDAGHYRGTPPDVSRSQLRIGYRDGGGEVSTITASPGA